MKDWERATRKFLKNWENKKEVQGALVCGSYVTGRPTENSDIDLHIILDDSCTWRLRGNEVVDGFLIEYFVNPPHQIEKYLEGSYKNNRSTEAHMFTTGKIIFGKNKMSKTFETLNVWTRYSTCYRQHDSLLWIISHNNFIKRWNTSFFRKKSPRTTWIRSQQ